MRDRMERFVILPFSLGCSTQSSVAVVTTTTTHHQHKKPTQLIRRREESGGNGSFKKEYIKMDNNGGNISDGIYKIIRSFKSFSHFFIRYEEETKEKEAEMEIGFPTDVKHLSHIGVDGTMTTFDVSSSYSSSSSFPFPGSFHLTAV